MRENFGQGHQDGTWPYDDPVTGEPDRHKNSSTTPWKGAQKTAMSGTCQIPWRAQHRPSAIHREETRGKRGDQFEFVGWELNIWAGEALT